MSRPKVMVYPAVRGGMLSVVESYVRDGFVSKQYVELLPSYEEVGFAGRQVVFLRALSRFARLLATRRIGLLHVHAAMKGSFWRKAAFANLARARGVPVLFHLHGSDMKSFYARQVPWLKRAIVRELSRATRVVVLSESWRDYVREIAPGARPVVAPNYVEMPDRPVRDGRGPPQVLFLGLVGERKGVYDLLEAFATVRATRPDATLVIGGNGEVERARTRARELGLGDAVRFEGWVGHDRRAELLRAADIYALPSYNEGLPMSVIEAMSYGLPIVTSDVGGLPELVSDGVHGRVVLPGDTAGLADAIAGLAADPDLRRTLGEAGRRRIEASYSRDVALPALERLYDEVAARPDGAGRPA